MIGDVKRTKGDDVSTTTSVLEELVLSGQVKLPNIRITPEGRWQVRVHPFPAENFASLEDAIAREAELRALREAGLRHRPVESATELPLSEWGDRLLLEKRTRGGKKGPLSSRGDRFWVTSVRPWAGEVIQGGPRDGERVFESEYADHRRWEAARDARGAFLADRPLSSIALLEVETYVQRRVLEARSQAAYEVQGLKAILSLARKHGAAFDDRLLELEPVVIPKSTRGLALDEEQTAFLVARAPEHSRRALSLLATVGFRLEELLALTDDRVNFDRREVYIPDPKERREKTIPLMTSETNLLREQRVVRKGQTGLLFPRPGGTPWGGHFWDDVLVPTRRRAVEDWRKKEGHDPKDETRATPFDRIDNHRLRHTAITLMARAGLKPELIAQRVGHNDGGALVLKRYRHVLDGELRNALDDVGTSLLGVAVG